MGTSSDHPGGGGTAWAKARSSGRDWASAGGGSGPGLIRLVADAAAALGGHESSAATAAAGPALARIGGLAAGPNDQSLASTLRERGIDLTDRPPHEVHAALVDYIAGDPEDRDSDLVRAAADEAVAEALEDADDLDSLVLDEAATERMMTTFVTEWLTRLISRDLGPALIDQNPHEAEQRSAEIREYIAERLANLLADRSILDIDWSSTAGDNEAQRILADAREVFVE